MKKNPPIREHSVRVDSSPCPSGEGVFLFSKEFYTKTTRKIHVFGDPKKGTISQGNSIFQPLILRGMICEFSGEYIVTELLNGRPGTTKKERARRSDGRLGL